MTDRAQLRLVDMAGNPLPPEKIGTPGRSAALPATYAANPDYEANLNRFNQLADVVLDAEGKYTDDEKLDAWNSQFRMAVTGQLMGMGPEVSKKLNDIAKSPTYQAIESARVSLMNVQMAAVARADASGGDRQQTVAQATLDHLKGLSSFDQKLTFTSVNAPDMTGASPYRDIGAWKQQLGVWAGLFAPLGDSVRLDLSEDAKDRLGPLKASPLDAPKIYAPGDKLQTLA